MPKWFIKAVFYMLIVGLIITGMLSLLTYLQLEQRPDYPMGQATIDTTALAELTLTPGYSVAQNATAVFVAKPTPYTQWEPADAEIFINIMRPKAYTETRNLLISSELGSPGAGWVCIQIATDVFGVYQITGDTYCRISLVWTDWQLVVNPEDFEIQVEEGSHVQIPMVDADGNDYFEERALAQVTIVIDEVGLNSPGIRFDQRFDFYKDLSGGWNLILDLRQLLFGEDLRQEANELTSDAPDLALADSFAPLMPDGSRSELYSDQLYQAFVDSLTTPGEQHVYNSLLDTAQLVAGYRCPAQDETCVDHNYAGLESLTVVIPAKPGSPCDYVYADDMQTQVLPQEYCTYTFTPTQIGSEALTEMALTIDQASLDPSVGYESLIEKLFSIR